MKTLKNRRKKGQTDYSKRIKLLKSGVPRVVFRKTNRYIIAQYITSKGAIDKVIIGLSSRILLNYGWPKEKGGSLKSISASYLTGFLIGKKILKKKLETPICDSGMVRKIQKNRFFAFLNGLQDSGVKIKCDGAFFPDENRLKGKHLKEDFSKTFEKIKSNIEKEFAEALDAREDIKLFSKLPGWFKVETPIGTYNPDWAIVKQEEGEAKKLYLVRETKATKDQLQLRGSEWAKIQCGTAHFEALDVSFKHITSAAEV